jgi:hypothetical protein
MSIGGITLSVIFNGFRFLSLLKVTAAGKTFLSWHALYKECTARDLELELF